MEGTNHKCIRKLLVTSYRTEATQAAFTNSYILLEIISLSSLGNTLALLISLIVVVKHKKEKKMSKSTLLSLAYFSVKITSISQN